MKLTHDQIAAVLADLTGTSAEGVTPDTLISSLEMDSLLIAEFVTILADDHDVAVSDDLDITDTTTVRELLTSFQRDSAGQSTVGSGAA
ncbi:acyl carrier protein [Streptomyces sp. NPDC051183]|uniref:acyl carrier protein n=1 Tax=unclassified Streptomyces TaxID=2593676 RepID=UPI003442158C